MTYWILLLALWFLMVGCIIWAEFKGIKPKRTPDAYDLMCEWCLDWWEHEYVWQEHSCRNPDHCSCNVGHV